MSRIEDYSCMQNEDYIWFLDIDFVEETISRMVPVLFPNYDDGIPDFQYLGGSHGRGLLESALAQPQQTFFGEYLYPSISDKTAALIWSVTKNHPFNDGNKRAALTMGILFLAFNRYALLARQSEAVELCLKVAASEPDIDRDYISEWISERIISVDEFARGDANQPEILWRYWQSASDTEKNALVTFYKATNEILRTMQAEIGS